MTTVADLMSSFGPCGRKKLIVQSGSRIVVTNDMNLLLQHCNTESIIDRIMLDVSFQCGNTLGDHSMTSLLIMTTTLNSIKTAAAEFNLQFALIQRVLGNIARIVSEPDLEFKIAQLLSSTVSPSPPLSTEQWCRSVWHHVLISSCNEALATSLADVLWLWVGKTRDMEVSASADSLVDVASRSAVASKNLPRLCLFTDNPALVPSRRAQVCNADVIIEGRFRASSLAAGGASRRSHRRFLCIRYICAPDGVMDDHEEQAEGDRRFVVRRTGSSLFQLHRERFGGTSVSVGSSNQDMSAVDADTSQSAPVRISTPASAPSLDNITTVSICRLLPVLQAAGVDYLVTCDSLPTEAISLLTVARITLVDRVPRENYNYFIGRVRVDKGVLSGFDTAQEFINSELKMDACDAGIDGQETASGVSLSRFGCCTSIQAVRLSVSDPHAPLYVRIINPRSDSLSAAVEMDQQWKKVLPPQLLLFGGVNAAISGTYSSLLRKCLNCITATSSSGGDSVENVLPLLVRGYGNAEMLWSLVWDDVAEMLIRPADSLDSVDALREGGFPGLRGVVKELAMVLWRWHPVSGEVHCCHHIARCLSNGYAEVGIQLLRNALRKYSPPVAGILHHSVQDEVRPGHDDRALLRRVFARAAKWRASLRGGETLSADDRGASEDGSQQPSRDAPQLELHVYPFSSFWTVFQSVLDTVRMLTRLGGLPSDHHNGLSGNILQIKGSISMRERSRMLNRARIFDNEV